MIQLIMINILKSSILGSIGIAILIILKKFPFKKYTNLFNYYIWLGVLFVMITPFKISIYLPEKLARKYNNSYIKIPTELSNFTNMDSNILYDYNSNNIDILKILFYIWILGVIVFIAYNLFNYRGFLRKIKSLSQNVYDENINSIYLNLLSTLNITRNIPLYYCKDISTPLGVGVLKPVILLPEVDYSDEEISWILKHELVHHKRYDIIYKIFLLITITLHWFNPLVYIMQRLINHDCELSCDEAVLKNCNVEERKNYALTLVDSIRINKNNNLKNSISTGFNNKKILERRLENMFNLKLRKKGFAVATLIGVLSISSIISIKAFAKEDIDKPLYKNNIGTIQNNITNKVEQKTTNGVQVLYSGPSSKIPIELSSQLNLSSVIKSQIKKEPNAQFSIITGFIKHTYDNAPKDIKSEYESNCNLVGKVPSASNEIIVPSDY